MQGTSAVYFILFVIILLGFAFFISARLTKRAVFKVLHIFRDENAVGYERARTIEQLGLTPPNILERIGRPRDYRQNALKILIKTEVVQLTEDGRLFIPEEKMRELVAKGILK